jgi:hypothetical protein
LARWQVQLKKKDVRAALAYAAEKTRERVIPLATETIGTRNSNSMKTASVDVLTATVTMRIQKL